MAEKALLTNSFNVEIFGIIMRIDNFHIRSKNMEIGKGKQDI